MALPKPKQTESAYTEWSHWSTGERGQAALIGCECVVFMAVLSRLTWASGALRTMAPTS